MKRSAVVKPKRMIEIESVKQLLKDCEERAISASIGLSFDLFAGVKDRLYERMTKILQWGVGTSITNQYPCYLPEGVKFVFQRGKSVTFIIEQKPQVRTVHFDQNFVDGHYSGFSYGVLKACAHLFKGKPEPAMKRHFRLAFPYVIFVVNIKNNEEDHEWSNCWLYFSDKPFVSLKQELFLPCLPNICKDGEVCLDVLAEKHFQHIADGKYGQAAEEMIDSFWKSSFNGDIVDCFLRTRYRDKRLGSLWHWEKNSKKDPAFMLSVKWLKPLFRTASLRSERVDYLNDQDFSVKDSIDKMIGKQVAGDRIKKRGKREIQSAFKMVIDKIEAMAQNGDT